MIISLTGGVGSGKSITAVHYALQMAKQQKVITNFKLKQKKNYYRLKKNDVVLTTKEIPEGCRKEKITQEVNWDFWQKNTNTQVLLDEIHNLVNSRSAMSKENKIYNEWISQIRKIWGSSGDQNYLDQLIKLPNMIFNKVWIMALLKSNNLIWITQKARKADINWRELTHVHIKCKKQKIGNAIIINNLIYFGNDEFDAFEMAEMGQKPKLHRFLANNYFGKYDSYEILGKQGDYL